MTGASFRRLCRYWWGILLALPCLGLQQGTSYVVRFPNAVHHEADIEATFSGVTGEPLDIVMSRSSPGRYALAEFAKNAYNVKVTDGRGKLLLTEHPDTYTWRVPQHDQTVVFRYTLFGDHADGTYAGIDQTHAHLNMPAAFAWAKQLVNAPFTFHFEVPADSGWTAATQLLPSTDGSFHAPNLELMMDSPVELSRHELIEWHLDEATFRLALHHRGTKAEAEQYARYCQSIVREEKAVFGALPHYDGGTYTFLADFLPYVYGDGMEHRDSTVMTAAADLKTAAARLAGTASHEFFHSWNVRRIRPRSLEPFDFERADMSGELWFAEGFTQYYGQLVLARTGIESNDDFFHQLGQMVNTVMTAPGRQVHSAVEMSELAPYVDAAQSVDATNFSNTFISYYTYGGALAFGMDLMLREHYPGRTLDDWMRVMWHKHPDIQKPYTLTDLESALAEVTGDQTFAQQVFEHHIEGKEPLLYADLAAAAGLLLRPAHPGEAWLGISSGGRGTPGMSIHKTPEGLSLEGNARVDSPFYMAGLEGGDVILEWDGKPATSVDLNEWLKAHHPGETVKMRAKARAGEKEMMVRLAENPQLELVTFEKAGRPISDQIRAFRRSWLSSKVQRTGVKSE